MAKFYYYRVAYIYMGKRGTQQIHSQNPEANLALAQEAVGLLADSLKHIVAPPGSQVQVVGIQGITDGKQSWPPLPVKLVDSVDAGQSGQLDQGLSLEGLNLGGNVSLNLSPVDVLTANGLPTPEAAKGYKVDQLQGLAAQLRLGDVSKMAFPQLRKAVLAALEEALKAAA